MMIPVVLLIISYIIQNNQIKEQTRITEDQFKEQNEITEKQFKEQIKITKEQFKEQNEISERQRIDQNKIAEKQLKEQNEIAINKEKRMLVTQIRLAKYEELCICLTECYLLFLLVYENNTLYISNQKSVKQFEELNLNLVKEKSKKLSELEMLLVYLPVIRDDCKSLTVVWAEFDLETYKVNYPKDSTDSEFSILHSEYKDVLNNKKKALDSIYFKIRRCLSDARVELINDLELDLLF